MSQHADSELYGLAMAEIDRPEGPDRGVMAKALTMAEGDTVKARALYVRYRVEQIQAERRSAKLAAVGTGIIHGRAARTAAQIAAALLTSLVLIAMWGVATQILIGYTHFGRCIQLVLFACALLCPWVFLCHYKPYWALSAETLGKWLLLALTLDIVMAVTGTPPREPGESGVPVRTQNAAASVPTSVSPKSYTREALESADTSLATPAESRESIEQKLLTLPPEDQEFWRRRFESVGILPPRKDSALVEGYQGLMGGLVQTARGFAGTMLETGIPGGAAADTAARILEKRTHQYDPYEGYSTLASFTSLPALGRTVGQAIGTRFP